MSGPRRIGDVKVGDLIPPVVKNASRAQLFLFSAATNNPHRIHYDRAYADSEGYADLLVHGPLQGAWLHQFVSDWAGPHGRVLAPSRSATSPSAAGSRRYAATKSFSRSGRKTTPARC
jgi:acyl dehydratase